MKWYARSNQLDKRRLNNLRKAREAKYSSTCWKKKAFRTIDRAGGSVSRIFGKRGSLKVQRDLGQGRIKQVPAM